MEHKIREMEIRINGIEEECADLQTKIDYSLRKK